MWITGCNEDDKKISPNVMIEDGGAMMVENYAKDGGISIIEAERQLTIMDKSDEIYHKLATTFSEDSLSSVYFIPGKDFGLGVRLSGNTNYDMKELVLNDGTIVPVTLTNKEKYNAQGIQDYMASVTPLANETFKGITTMGYEFATNSVVISIDEPDLAVRELNNLIDLKTIIPDMDSRIEYVDLPLQEISLSSVVNKVTAGGRYKTPGNCTSGFTGTVNGVQGFLTATHCNTNNTYLDHFSNYLPVNTNSIITNYSTAHEISFVPTPQWQIYGGSYDLIFGSSGNGPLKVKGGADEFIYIDGTRRIGEPPVAGTYLCHFGQASGYSCGYVTAVETVNIKSDDPAFPNGKGCNSKFSPFFSVTSQPCASTFYKMEGPDLACYKGDSGGPVFRRPSSRSTDIRAYGIANSAAYYNETKGNCTSLRFSSVFYAEKDYGFKLKTEL